ncbi:MAG: asparagine synthase (glutamine-hydrolyzing) [Kiritimatiellae bacterium]|nr:asparagine synthase (glutamine-hydrolyzing) [Kiritimatiellia bacterium]
MCGIVGIINRNGDPVSSVVLNKMTDAMTHRGPDGEGFYTDRFMGLGHRRLSIIDLSSAGHQPMTTLDRRYVISYNGELYNFQELRIELESLGHRFHSRTDTEVVLYAYAQWKEKALDRFNGMFAFAVWDTQKEELFLARDRYGIKPLYYSECGNVFLFGSEIKAILQHPAYDVGLDKEGLLEYFTFQNFFTDRTLFQDVRILPAGTHMSVSQSCVKGPYQYWDFNFFEPDTTKDEQAYEEELDRLLRQAVSRQIVSDVEIGSYLSGGIDSGTLTALAAIQLPYLKTFTCGFDLHSASGIELSFDEREKAEFMSYTFKTEHYEMVLKAGDMERVMPQLAWHIEEPRVGQSYPSFYAAQLASKFVKVVLSGGGGDELFGGYPWRYYRAIVNNDFEHYIDQYYGYWQRIIPNTVIRETFKPIWPDVEHVWTRDVFRDVFSHHASQLTRPEDYINHSLYFEAKTFLHGLLVVEDKLSMAHGLETRVPFLDNDLVDFSMRLPVQFKLAKLKETVRINENDPGLKQAKYYRRTNDGKVLLRKAMSRHIPSEIVESEKQGFSAPDASWFKGESIKYVRELLLNPHAKLYTYLDAKVIEDLVTEHLEGRQNRRLLIWSLLSMEHWCRTFLR